MTTFRLPIVVLEKNVSKPPTSFLESHTTYAIFLMSGQFKKSGTIFLGIFFFLFFRVVGVGFFFLAGVIQLPF